jgi:hypothetical protein
MDLSDGVADLHVHTTASDGTCSVAARVDQARERGLDAIAVTDHDTVAADVVDRRTVRDGVELVAGVEVRADVRNTKVELLGYYVDPADEGLADTLDTVRAHRRARNRRIVDRLQEVAGLDRSYESIRAESDGILGRPHVAGVLVEAGVVDSVGDAFDEYLGSDGAAFVPMERVPAPDVVDAIRGAGGVVSLAHPGRVRSDDVEGILADLVAAGLDAIEVRYPYDEAPSEGYADVSVDDAAALAERYDLFETGGSDCHGPDSGKFRIGEVRVTAAAMDALRERAGARRPL